MMHCRFLPLLLALVLAGCAATSEQNVAPVASAPPPPSGSELLLKVRAAAHDDGDALDVQPLRDPVVDDLLAEAEALERQGDFAGAAQRLQAALALTPGDPGLRQQRAELLLAEGALDEAETEAWAAFESGPRVGPLCRRSWTTVQLARSVRGDPAGADKAAQQVGRCATPPPVRM